MLYTDEACFQIVHIEDVITLKAASVSSKKKWMSQIEAAGLNALQIERDWQVAHR